MTRRTLLALALMCVPARVDGTTFVVFRAARIILASDSFGLTLDATGRRDVTVPCKIRQVRRTSGGTVWFLNGGLFTPDIIADRVARAATMRDALSALDDGTLRDRVIANKALYSERPAGGPLLTAILADGDTLAIAVFVIVRKDSEAFEVETQSGTCPGALCPLGSYFLVGQAAGAAPAALPAWFPGDATAATARRFIEAEIGRVPHLARPPIDVLELAAAGARWIERDAQSACAAIP
jgi:hypothetical protein